MRVIVVEHHDDGRRRIFDGAPPDVAADLLHAYPFLQHKLGPHADVTLLVKALDATQAYTAVTQEADIQLLKADADTVGVGESVVADMMGHDITMLRLLNAGAFLSGKPVPGPGEVRAALHASHEDPELAVLNVYGLDPSPETVEALHAILCNLRKAEPDALPQHAEAVTESGAAFADMTNRALKDGAVHPVQLGGKHSAGTLLAWDPQTDERILLKPGAGGSSPAAGVTDSGSSQSKREAAFWQVAAAWGLGDDLPEAHLLLLDGREYAGLKLLAFSYQNMNKAMKADSGLPRRLFHLFLGSGRLHRWATLDYILGNTDRHAGNIMVRGADVKLIDHGSALAGADFAPGSDRYSFVPFYLRALAPADFGQLSSGDQLKALPRLSAPAAADLRSWLDGLDGQELAATLHRYGVDAAPSVNRLDHLKTAAAHTPADLAVNGAWVLP